MAVTEAEVKRLLADATGKRLHATRLQSLERLREHLKKEVRKSAAVSAAIDGLLAIATDGKQPADVRLRAAQVLGTEIDLDALRERFRAWPEGWTAHFRAIARASELPEDTRLLAVKTILARVYEERGLEEAATGLFIELLSGAREPIAIRIECLHGLADIHRSTPSFFADERRIGGLVTAPLPRSDAWTELSPEEKSLAAALVDPIALADLIDKRPSALEAASLHVQWDPSSAKLLAERVRVLPFDREVETRHAALLRAAVEYDRAHGVLELDWIAPAIVDVALAAAKQALQYEQAPSFDEHIRLWSDLFRDGARGLAERLLQRVRDDGFALPWISLHALSAHAADLAAEGDRRALALLRKKPKIARLDVLVGLVVPELAFDLQENGLLPAVDVPTEEAFARLYRDEAQTLPRRVRLADLVQHVTDVDDRFLVSLNLLPDVIRWLPSELHRFEPLLRASLDVIGSRTDRKLRAGPKLPFDAMLRLLEGLGTKSPVPLVAFARHASIHGLPASALAPFAADEPALRAFWSALMRSQNLPLEKRIDAWHALDVCEWPEKEDELGEMAEEILVRADDSEMNAFLVEPFRRRWPVRFATIAARLRISVPPISRISVGARDALAAAVSAEETLETIEGGHPIEKLLGALALLRGVVGRRPDLRDRAQKALSKRVTDTRMHESTSVAVAAFGEQVALFERDAAQTLARALDLGEDLAQATELARRFAETATSPMKQAALVELERGMARLLGRTSRSCLQIESILGAYCEAIALLGDAMRLRDRLRRVVTDRTAKAGARYASFAVLEAAKDVDRDALLDAAVAMFFDEKEDRAFRALLGGMVTIGKPQAFVDIVDMNLQPWVVRQPEHANLPANSLPANMPMSWLIATLISAEHDEPLGRAATEIATRIEPAKSWEWAKARVHFMNLMKGQEDAVRRGLRDAVAGSLDAAKLLALFGNFDDTEPLASVAAKAWTTPEQEAALPDTVFWRPAGKSPAFGRYSYLEPWLEAGFGTQDRYRILSLAYAELANHAEGGDASRYAYEAFLLDPGSSKASEAMSKFG